MLQFPEGGTVSVLPPHEAVVAYGLPVNAALRLHSPVQNRCHWLSKSHQFFDPTSLINYIENLGFAV